LILIHVIDPTKQPELQGRRAGIASRVGFESSARVMLSASLPTRERLSVEEVVAWGLPAPEILDLAGAQGAGVIVVGMHGRALPDLMALGSVAHQLVRESTCPVLAVRPCRDRTQDGAAVGGM
jgi:nucleotide-binding universal stress UspA family protein